MSGFDYSSSFAGINSALANIGKQNDTRWLREAQADVGQSLQGGDYAGAAQKAFSYGDSSTGLGLLKLGQAQQQEKDWMNANSGIFGGVASPAGATAPASVAVGTPNEIEKSFVDTVKGAGLTNPIGLSAVAAYGRAESGFAPQNVNRSWSDPSQSGQAGTAGGIMSWRADRLQNLQRFAQSRGEQGNGSPVTQALFLAQEDPTLIPKLQAAKTPQEANQIMANAWRFAGYDKQGGENARRLALTQRYAQRFGAGTAAPASIPVQVAENEADVQRLEAQQGNPVFEAPGRVQVAQAPSPSVSDAPAPGAVEAQFFVPGSDAPVPQSIANDPQVLRLQKALAGAPDRFKASIQARLSTLIEDLKSQRSQSAPTELQKNYNFYAQQERAAGRDPMNFQQFRESTKPQTNVNVGGGSDKQIFDVMQTGADAAQTAATGLQSIREARRAVEAGGYFGAGADLKLGLQKAAQGLGIGDPNDLGKIVNTETFRSAIAPQIAATMKATVGSTQISNADRDFAEKAAGGSITLDENSIKRLLGIMEKANTAIIQRHQKRLDTVYPEEGGKFARERSLFGVEMPVEPPAPPAPPQAPPGYQGAPGASPPGPPAPPAPPTVRSQIEYDRIKSGDQYMDPNGNIRTKR